MPGPGELLYSLVRELAALTMFVFADIWLAFKIIDRIRYGGSK